MCVVLQYILLGLISLLVRENPPRQVISISPTYNYATVRPHQPYMDPTSGYSIFFIWKQLDSKCHICGNIKF